MGSANGVTWHPLVSPSDTDMLVTQQIFPLVEAVRCIEAHLRTIEDKADERTEFT